jgi:hypothetical protein
LQMVHTIGATGAGVNSKTYAFGYDFRHQLTRVIEEVWLWLQELVGDEATVLFSQQVKTVDGKLVPTGNYDITITANEGKDLSKVTKDLIAIMTDPKMMVTIVNTDETLAAKGSEERKADHTRFTAVGPGGASVENSGGAMTRRSSDSAIVVIINGSFVSQLKTCEVSGSSKSISTQRPAVALGYELGGHVPRSMWAGDARNRERRAIGYENAAIRYKLGMAPKSLDIGVPEMAAGKCR